MKRRQKYINDNEKEIEKEIENSNLLIIPIPT